MINLSSKSNTLEEAQRRQEATQFRMHQHLESSVGSILGKLIDVEGTANILQKAIREATESIASITAITSAVDSCWKMLSFPVFVGMLVLAGLWLHAGGTRIATLLIGKVSSLAQHFLLI